MGHLTLSVSTLSPRATCVSGVSRNSHRCVMSEESMSGIKRVKNHPNQLSLFFWPKWAHLEEPWKQPRKRPRKQPDCRPLLPSGLQPWGLQAHSVFSHPHQDLCKNTDAGPTRSLMEAAEPGQRRVLAPRCVLGLRQELACPPASPRPCPLGTAVRASGPCARQR